ncbi:uncharacterized protein LOC121370211 isoform X2 [Gigantopelta aegis]|uniref:uncharacterized protein LOC121370211 isoform X2 n=1 Tax=Gigantopelta aegis TaxID=1735272 RepID=UPI001B88D661|nr:uncharacterized protein LOC121370211 isoform X2 [Gigantopelta aegis]
MASDGKTPGNKEVKNEAFSELPENQYNQVQPQKSEEKDFKADVPGDYKIRNYDDPSKILDAAPPLRSDTSDDGNKVNNVKQNNKNNGKTPGNKEFKNEAFSELPENQFKQVQPQKSEEKDLKADIPGNYKLTDCKEFAVRSAGCSGMSTGRPCGTSQPSSAEPFVTAKDADSINRNLEDKARLDAAAKRCPSHSSLNDYYMLDYETSFLAGRCPSLSLQLQARGFNIPANMIRTVSSEDDNRTYIEDVTRMESFMDSGGAASADDRGESCGGASYGGSSPGAVSSMPSDGVFLVDLKLEIIKLLQIKLETNIGKGWQELASLKDWNYSKIHDFENHCMASHKSPFQSLLSEHEFQQYTLGELKGDLDRLPRKDVLRALNTKMQELYH